MNERYWIEPGFGNFGDRYFGTASTGASASVGEEDDGEGEVEANVAI